MRNHSSTRSAQGMINYLRYKILLWRATIKVRRSYKNLKKGNPFSKKQWFRVRDSSAIKVRRPLAAFGLRPAAENINRHKSKEIINTRPAAATILSLNLPFLGIENTVSIRFTGIIARITWKNVLC
jgi:hypothetical protein